MIPLHNLSKKEIVYRATHRCKHAHTFLEHPVCYTGRVEKIGFFDIETTNLDAPFGFVVSYCIKDSVTGKIIYNVIRPQDIKNAKSGDEDKVLMKQMIEDLKQFDRIVTHYGKRFDVPFIRTRALILGIPFLAFGTLNHTDTYFIAKFKLKLGSNRLENIERNLFGETLKTKIEPKYWRAASRGDKKSLAYILDHNKRDVISLEKIYNKLIGFVKEAQTSI